ncbi:hypothetical protein EVAR_22666_1 [Eumeta japonica]|uniref:Uncharacterized protein n=1 Tax=Eumeta variegata TaxID=151549 RepID=A0A4C1VL70_EUMVA|nr:hypothetical protein EVAR_22666_1 [Eumeta japonica]
MADSRDPMSIVSPSSTARTALFRTSQVVSQQLTRNGRYTKRVLYRPAKNLAERNMKKPHSRGSTFRLRPGFSCFGRSHDKKHVTMGHFSGRYVNEYGMFYANTRLPYPIARILEGKVGQGVGSLVPEGRSCVGVAD